MSRTRIVETGKPRFLMSWLTAILFIIAFPQAATWLPNIGNAVAVS